jgi:hypothetical protein
LEVGEHASVCEHYGHENKPKQGVRYWAYLLDVSECAHANDCARPYQEVLWSNEVALQQREKVLCRTAYSGRQKDQSECEQE